MKIITVFILILYSACTFSQSDWVNYIAKKEKGIMSFSVNLDFNNSHPNYKNLLIVGTKYKNCLKNGFPKEDSLDKLYTFSDSTAVIIEKLTKYKLVGVITYLCTGFDIYYVKDTLNIRNNIDRMIASNFNRSKNYIVIEQDKKWNYYFDRLFPENFTNIDFINHEYLIGLVSQGDDLNGLRKVNHWVSFKSDNKRLKFIQQIKSLNFDIDSINYQKENIYPYVLKVSRKDSINPKSITQLTQLFQILVKANHDSYDGWGTEVIIKD